MNNKLLKLRIGYLPILDHLTLAIAENLEGKQFDCFDLQAQEFLNWDEIAQALDENRLDAAYLLAPLAMELFRKNHNIKIVLLGHREGQVLVVNNQTNKLPDLIGKRIHLPHRFSTHHILLASEYAGQNINLSDSKLSFGYKNIRLASHELALGKTDAFMLAEPMGTEARRQGIGKILILSQEILSHHVDCVLAVNKNFIDNHKDSVQELVNKLVRAGSFINAYPRQAAEIAAKQFSWPKKIVLEALTHHHSHISYWDLLPRLEDFEQLQNMAIAVTDLWKEPINISDLLESEFAQRAYRDWIISSRKQIKDRGQINTLPTNALEATERLKIVIKKTIKIAGIHYIESGEHYPAGLDKIKSTKKNIKKIVEEIVSGKELVLTDFDRYKAMALMRLDSDRIPDKILLKIDFGELEKFQQVLGLGNKSYIFDKTADFLELFTSSNQSIVYQNQDNFYLVISWQVFRFLILHLENF